MGQLVAGVWQKSASLGGGKQQGFGGRVRSHGQPGPDGRFFPLAAGRYHLVVAWSCPFAHRALLARALLGLTPVVGLDVVEPVLGDDGWRYAAADERPSAGSTHDTLLRGRFLRQLYQRADPHFTGRVTVPVLWDRQQNTVVSNDSTSIVHNFAQDFVALVPGQDGAALLPEGMGPAFDAVQAALHRGVTAAVYRAGFACTQAVYDAALAQLFAHLAALDQHLACHRFLLGAAPCALDLSLWSILVRFDAVYVTHFKCNRRRLVDYRHLWPYARDMMQWPGVAETVHWAQIKAHYFLSHRHLNPSGIVAEGFVTDWAAPAGRERLGQGAADQPEEAEGARRAGLALLAQLAAAAA